MPYSKNTLVVEDIRVDVPKDTCGPRTITGFAARLSIRVDFTCKVTGKVFKSVIVQTDTGRQLSQQEALKTVISNFMEGKSYVSRSDYFDTSNSHSIQSKKIHFVDVQLPEPYSSFFADLFDIKKWKYPEGLFIKRSMFKTKKPQK